MDPLNKKGTVWVALSMGFTNFLLMNLFMKFSGGSFNPFRSITPALLIGIVDREQFIHLFAPLCGCVVGSFFYRGLFLDDDDDLKDEIDNIREK